MEPVDWASLEHAYGSAEEVPELLRAIGEGKAAAVDGLRNRVAHQGWASPAVAAALVSPLLELTGETKGATLAGIVRLLADLACAGSHEHFMARGFEASLAAGFLSEPSIVGIRERLAEVDATPWLSNRSKNVRSAAALFLAFTGQDASEAVSARLAKEKDADVGADLLLTLGWMATEPTEAIVARQEDERPLVSAAAWIATAFASEALNETLELGLQLAAVQQPGRCAWAEGEIGRLAVEVLSFRAEVEGRPEAMVGLMESVDGMERTKLGAALLKNAFREELKGYAPGKWKEPAEPPPLESLTEEQRMLLKLLTRFGNGWGYSNDQAFWLRMLGFPRSPPGMLTYLGEPPPPDERDAPFAFREHEGTLAEVLAAVCTEEGKEFVVELAEATREQVDLGELVEVVEKGSMVKVPWGFTRTAWAVHVLASADPAVAVAIRERLERYCRSGVPSYWEGNTQYLLSSLPLVFFAALLRHQPKAEVPRSFPIGPSAATRWRKNLRDHEPEAAKWLRKALKKATAAT